MFSERQPGEVLFFVLDHGRGEKIRGSVAEGDNVSLMLGKDVVFVSGIQVIGPAMYRGTISGFKSSVSAYESYSEGPGGHPKCHLSELTPR